ncbi:hypothetical protein BWK63_04980 [Flavobacterium covae]|nr:hypothetical protein BWK63_04980 [Flavobacterium covae]
MPKFQQMGKRKQQNKQVPFYVTFEEFEKIKPAQIAEKISNYYPIVTGNITIKMKKIIDDKMEKVKDLLKAKENKAIQEVQAIANA